MSVNCIIYQPNSCFRFDPDGVPSSVIKALTNKKQEKTRDIDPCLIFEPPMKQEVNIEGWENISAPRDLAEQAAFSFLQDKKKSK